MLDNLTSITTQIPAITSQIVNTMFIILGIIIFVGILVYILYIKSFKKEVIIRELINGRVIIKRDKARTKKDKKGVMWWQLREEKDKDKKFMPVPPAGVIDIDAKGKEFVEVYRTENGMYIFLKDMCRVAEIPKDLLKGVPEEFLNIQDTEKREKAIREWKEFRIAEWKREKGVVEAFQPFTTQQRVLTVNSIMDAQERRGNSMWENIPQLAALGALVIIVVCLMIFWADIAKPVIEAKEMSTSQLSMMKEIVQTQKDMALDIQTFKSEQTPNKKADTPPN